MHRSAAAVTVAAAVLSAVLVPVGTPPATADVHASAPPGREASDRPTAPDLVERRERLVARLSGLLEPIGHDGLLRAVPRGYDTRVRELPPALRDAMTGVSWEPGCPVGLDDLRLLEVVHHDLDQRRRWGRMVVHRDVVAPLAQAFGDLHDRRFGIARMRLVDLYGADDDASMEANNTSAFNCRPIAGTDRWSEHAYGRAVDLNPAQNPYVRGDTVLPEAGRAYLDREDVRPGMLVRPGPVEAFDRIGWGWGGDWRTLEDHMHVSSTGR